MKQKASGKISVLVVAGETSGDMHTAKVISQLNNLEHFNFFGIGGDAMADQGVEIIFHVNQMAFMGFLEVVKHLPFIKKVFKSITNEMDIRKPDMVLLTDYPGFNLKLARAAKKRNIPVVYFISPQVWAWGKNRISKIVRYVDKMLVILPFEKELYANRGLDTEFVGHPLKDSSVAKTGKKKFFDEIGINISKPCIALLPGSRKQEIFSLIEPMIKGFNILRDKHPDIQGIIVAAPHIQQDIFSGYISDSISIVYNKTREVLSFCDAAIVASGTATLECAITSTPMVVVYRLTSISYFIGKILIKLDSIALANIVAGKKIVPELIQHNAKPEKIAEELGTILFESNIKNRMKQELEKVSKKLGPPGAEIRAAHAILEFLNKRGIKTA